MLNINERYQSFAVTTGGDSDPQAFLNADQRGGVASNGKPSKTIDQAGLHLVGGEPGWSSALGVAYTVTYAFRSTAPTTMPEDTGGFTRFNAAQIAQTEQALAGWSDVANITFVRVGSGTGDDAYSDSASILLANYASGEAGSAAFAEYPGNANFSSTSGDVWVNSTLSYNRAPVAGNYGALVLVHELGHAIGLSHPGDYNAGDSSGDITYAHDAEYYEDSLQYTVMSYFDETDTGADYRGVYSASPLLDDIAAAQAEYGANITTRTGDTIYGFNATADRSWFQAASSRTKLVFAVWDAGGVDTFDFSGYGVAQTIDLREGFFSSVGGLVGNVAIAKGAAIENAIGGSDVDTITGNALSNRLEGGLGADTLSGLGGADLLIGGAGNDILIGGLGDDSYVLDTLADQVVESAGEGWDAIYVAFSYTLGANVESLTLQGSGANGYGNDLANALYGNGLSNYLNGGAGDDYLSAGGGADILDGGTGGDILEGGAGDDSYGVDSVYDSIRETADGGWDAVYASFDYTLGANIESLTLQGAAAAAGYGSGTANAIYGNGLNNYLNGGGGDDYLFADTGNDILDGGTGADIMDGGLGDDSYAVDSSSDIVREAVNGGWDAVYATFSYALGANIESLTLQGAAVTGYGNDMANAVYGNAVNNYLNGGAGNDYLSGGGGSDILDGGTGVDIMDGGAGDDSYAADTVGDVARENAGEGWDAVYSTVNYVLGANLEALTLQGTAVSGTGNALANALYGNAVANTLSGGGGADYLAGGAGDDTLTGGAGDDRFVFAAGSGTDRVTDFGAGGDHDRLDLSAYAGTGVTWSVAQVSADTVVSFTNGDAIILAGFDHNHLQTSGDFLLAV